MIPYITPLSPGPNRATMNSDEYVVAADATMSELPVMVDEANASIAGLNDAVDQVSEDRVAAEGAAVAAEAASNQALLATAFAATSSSSLTLDAGTKVVALDDESAFVDGDLVLLRRRGDPETMLAGEAQPGTTPTSLVLEVPEEGVLGTGGPYDDWIVLLAAASTPGATPEDVRAGVSTQAAVTPASLAEAVEFGTLTDASTVAWDVVADGVHAKLTLTDNGHTVGAPTGLLDGMTYVININPATYTCSWASIWDFGQVGPPSFPASAWSKVTAQYNADRGKLEAAVWRGA